MLSSIQTAIARASYSDTNQINTREQIRQEMKKKNSINRMISFVFKHISSNNFNSHEREQDNINNHLS